MLSTITKSRRGAWQGGLNFARRGFTLIEAVAASALVGLGVVALMAAAMSGTRTNQSGREIAQAVFLTQEIRELTIKLPFSDQDPGDMGNPPGPDGSDPQEFFDDLDDLMDVTFSPPMDGFGSRIADMPDWSQTITLTWRNPDNLIEVVPDGTSDVIYVEVTVSHHDREVLASGWLVTRSE